MDHLEQRRAPHLLLHCSSARQRRELLLPRITAKHGWEGSICWILDSAALEPYKLQLVSVQHWLSEHISAGLRKAQAYSTSDPLLKLWCHVSVGILSDPFSQTISPASTQIKKISNQQSLGRPRAIPAMTSLLRLMGWGLFPRDVTETRYVFSFESAGV